MGSTLGRSAEAKAPKAGMNPDTPSRSRYGDCYGDTPLMIYTSRWENICSSMVCYVPKLLQSDGDFDAIWRLRRVQSDVRI
jgi:hypothetical protein